MPSRILNLSFFTVKVLTMRFRQILPLMILVLTGCQKPGPPPAPAVRVLHICNWHYVPKDQFTADLKSNVDAGITEPEAVAQYTAFLDEVGAVQSEQIEALRKLIREHGLKHVWVEGLTFGNMPDFEELVRQTKKVETESLPRALNELGKVRDLLATLEPDSEESVVAQEVETKLVALVQEQRERRLRIGTAGILLMNGELERNLPLEEELSFSAANPVRTAGVVEFDQTTNEAREDAISARLLEANEPVAVVVLGVGHDLSDNLRRQTTGKADYQRIELPEYKRLMEKYDQ